MDISGQITKYIIKTVCVYGKKTKGLILKGLFVI